jgi:hypothetical protein
MLPRLAFALVVAAVVFGQEASNEQYVVVGNLPSSPSTGRIFVPPANREDMKKGEVPASNVDLSAWLARENALFGLSSPSTKPFRIVISYDEFDEDGDNTHSGVIDEYWIGPEKFKRTYKADDLNQTDFATPKGLVRVGDQRFARPPEIQVLTEVTDPFTGAETAKDVAVRTETFDANGTQLECLVLRSTAPNAMILSDPPKYCFVPGEQDLRYTRGGRWHQTVYNHYSWFQGRRIPMDILVTSGGKRYLKISVDLLEPLKQWTEAEFTPGSDGKLLGDERISGVELTVVKYGAVQWPNSLRGQHAEVKVQIVVGKDGHVKEAHAIDGPREAYKSCEKAAREFVFAPFTVMGRGAEVNYSVRFQMNDRLRFSIAGPA